MSHCKSAIYASLLFEPLSATTTPTTTTTTTVTTTTKTLPGATTTTTKTTTTIKTTTPSPAETTKSTTQAQTTKPTTKEPTPPPVTKKTTTTKKASDNTPASIADTESPNIDTEDSTRMPLEDAQKIFLPIVIIFTVIAIALAIGYFIKAGKTAMAKKWMIIFIGMCFVYVCSCFSNSKIGSFNLKQFVLWLQTQKSCCIGYFLNCNVGILWCLRPVLGETLENFEERSLNEK